MTSRLDRLFILLESGSSAVTRRAAAKQIGEVQKLYPHELHTLLNRLIGYLHSTSWDTRIAAAQTVEAILLNVPEWKPELYGGSGSNGIKKEEAGGVVAVSTAAAVNVDDNKDDDGDDDADDDDDDDDDRAGCLSIAVCTPTLTPTPPPAPSRANDPKDRLLSFEEFDLEQILNKGARLIGSEGNEFDLHDDTANAGTASSSGSGGGGGGGSAGAAERLSRQRALLNEKLGLTKAAKLGISLPDDMITDEDMRTDSTACSYNANAAKVPVEDILKIKPNANVISTNGQQLSCREMNRARRKARQLNNSTSTSSGGGGGVGVGIAGATTSSMSASTVAAAVVSVITTATATAATTATATAAAGTTAHTNNNNSNNSNRNGLGNLVITTAASNGGVIAAAPAAIGTLGSDEPDKKKLKLEANRQDIFYSLSDPVPDATGAWIDAVNWPLENFCARLYVDLFNPKWEVRHGAATALRELINNHSSGAGKSLGMSREEMQRHHCLWLEDSALRLLCVLCLDRFGDFISDQVVAPVRETCAQVLGTIVKEMDARKVQQIVAILLKLLKQSEWEVRHGGLLGLKYVFVVRKDLLHMYLPNIISDVLMGLFDAVDDVGAVAAATLIPVATWLPQLLNPVQVSSIVKMLWDLLLDQDELTSACNSFMGLLAAILCLPNASTWIQMEPMATLVPRLWPFLSHSTSSVRLSTLVTLETLTGSHIKKEPADDAPPQQQQQQEPVVVVKEEKVAESESESASEVYSNAKMLSDMNFDSKNLKLNFGVRDWQWKLLQEALRHIFQRILVEPLAEVQQKSRAVWMNLIRNADLGALLHAACPFVSSWICLAMQPARLAFDPAILINASSTAATATTTTTLADTPRRRARDDLGGSALVTQKLYLGGSEAIPLEVREQNYMRARIMASRVLGALSQYLVQPAPGVEYTPQMESPMDCYTKVLMGHLNSRSAVQRIVCGLIIAFWAQSDPTACPGDPKLQEKLRTCVMEYVYYDEVAISFTRLLQEAYDLIATLKQYKIPINDFNNAKVLTLDQIEAVATTLTANLHLHQLKPKLLETLQERRRALQASYQQTSAEQAAYNISTQSALAGAIVCLRCLPEKLNPVVKPLMESIKREDCEQLQQLSAEFLVHLMQQVCDRNPSPNNKILTNLCMLLKSDAEFTPQIKSTDLTLNETKPAPLADPGCVYYGILTLSQQHNTSNFRGGSGAAYQLTASGSAGSTPTGQPGSSRGPGRPPLSETLARDAANAAAAASADNNTIAQQMTELKQCRTQRLGASCAIAKLCTAFGASIMASIPIFEQLMFTKIEQFVASHPASLEELAAKPLDLMETNDLVTSLQLIEVAAPHMAAALEQRLFQLLPHFGLLIMHPLKAIRHMVARCIATLAAIDACRTMHFVVDHLVLLLRNIEHVIQRQGAIEAIERVVDKLQIKIVPYIVLLVVPLLGCMSDPDVSVRLLSTHCFATLIQLMPLDSRGNCAKNEIKSKELQARKTRDREFLDYLFAPKSIPDYKVPVQLSVELRTYQQAGVNWLWFLNKYNLHGILCDDMGLGKTLQTICILAGDHHQRELEQAAPLPSLVICPPTLTGHWVYEVEKFLNKSAVLRPLHYVGLPIGREKLRCRIGACNLVVASYDTIRKDIDYFSTIHWNYCVLDEGHIIKNGKTKSSKAIKQLKAKHRLILSGTPIQNNVLELWSLFDFLMPGFLGTEKQFVTRYSRPILASRDSKSSAKEQEAGVLAMESLHRQVLPFLLRRVKEDVLTDLPPKITQDLLCELSPLQERLYEDFSRTHLNSDLKDCLEHLGDTDNINTKTHIFHALRYLQNVCNHPKLVLTPKHPEYPRITHELLQLGGSLNEIEHSAKLPALKQLLLDCGIGVQTESVSQHRALIFCQLKAMLDIVEKDLLRKHLPTVSYLRLDGSVPASMRQDIVNTFNGDPSIDVLLLTTQVGGLGLNLTGADTVIFVEHDWNPMKDLQAMDRAHRIGQKKVVNVYRLITRKSLEEKIMGLQKFKILTANTVVSSENASMETMATAQIFDLFNLNDNRNGSGSGSGSGNGTTGANSLTKSASGSGGGGAAHVSVNAIIESLPELWSANQYDEEYDLSAFVQGLKK